MECHRGGHNRVCEEERFPKLTDLEVGFSRDGFHWHRPSRAPFLAVTRMVILIDKHRSRNNCPMSPRPSGERAG